MLTSFFHSAHSSPIISTLSTSITSYKPTTWASHSYSIMQCVFNLRLSIMPQSFQLLQLTEMEMNAPHRSVVFIGDGSQMTHLTCNMYKRWCHVQASPSQWLTWRLQVTHYTRHSSSLEKSIFTHLWYNMSNSSLERSSFTDNMSVIQYLPQFSWQMIIHRWHVCHAIVQTGGGTLTGPPLQSATRRLQVTQCILEITVPLTDDH